MSFRAIISRKLKDWSKKSSEIVREVDQLVRKELEDRIENVNKRDSYFAVISKIANEWLFLIFVGMLGFFLMINLRVSAGQLFIIMSFLIFGIIYSLRLDWTRSNKIKFLYLDIGEILEEEKQRKQEEMEKEENINETEDVDGEIKARLDEENIPERHIPSYFDDKIEDILNIRSIFLEIDLDYRIRNQVRNYWWQFWRPNIVTILNQYYGYPDNIVKSRLDFHEKLFDRVLLTVIIGVALITLRSMPVIDFHAENLQLIMTLMGVLIFMSLVLITVSYPLLRYPMVIREVIYWLNEREFDINIRSNHPDKLLDPVLDVR